MDAPNEERTFRVDSPKQELRKHQPMAAEISKASMASKMSNDELSAEEAIGVTVK